MIERLIVPVTVTVVFDHRARTVAIRQVTYDGRDYPIRRVSYHFTQRKGRNLVHVFSAIGSGVLFKLVFNTESLAWTLEEIHSYEFDPPAFQSQARDSDAH